MNTSLRLLWVLLWVLPVSLYAQDDDLLRPDQAFQVTARVLDASTVQVDWDITDGYYLYKDKFRFTSKTDGIALGEADFDKAQIKHDEFFGEVAIYHGRHSARIPLQRSGDARELKLKVRYQGCAERGICYPPQTKRFTLELPAVSQVAQKTAPAKPAPAKPAPAKPAPAKPAPVKPAPVKPAPTKPASGAKDPVQALVGLGQGLGLADANDEFLPPDQAFQLDVKVLDANTLEARWQITKGYYLYKEKFAAALQDRQGKAADGVRVVELSLPAGEVKDDEFFGRIEVFHHQVVARISLQRDNPATRDITLQAKFQGCAEAGICYPPITRYVQLELPPASAAGAASVAPAPRARPGDTQVSEQDRLALALAGGSSWLTILSFFGFGLLLAFTPCVFPMIPILSSIIVGHGEGLTTGKALRLSVVYVLAMAVTYTVAGVVAGLFGANLQAAFQNPWILGGFALIFVLLSLSMFGFYELQVPTSLQGRLTTISNRQQGGGYTGVAVMGLLSALIVGPCVAPPLMGALIYIGHTGDAVLGGLALFALSLGMGAPLLLVGASAGRFMPRAGSWMDVVKAVFGVLLLGVAVWMLERIIPGPVALLLYALLLIIPPVYMGTLEPLKVESSGWAKLWKGTGLAMLVYGAVLVVGAAGGGDDPFQPLDVFTGGGVTAGGTADTQPHGLNFQRIKSVADLQREVAAARDRGQPVMVDFYADWCVSCKEMEKYTFSDTKVQQALAPVKLLQADVTANDEQDKALLAHFNLFGPPSLLFYGRDGVERRGYRLVGYLPADEFLSHIQRALH